MADDDFEPRLGRIGSKGKGRGFKSRVAAAVRLARSGAPKRAVRFDGSRIGRGAGTARFLGSRDRLARFRARRVIIKTSLVRLAGPGLAAARAHLRYIQRDGVSSPGETGTPYGPDSDHAPAEPFLARASADRHQFRFIVSAEDGAAYPDLKPFVRTLMAEASTDLGTRLDWIAVDHRDTGQPHSHILLRGVDQNGANLVIARDYIAHGLRARASDIVTRDLGPRATLEIEQRLRRDMGAERLTPTDRSLLARAGADRIVTANDRDPFRRSLNAGRLKTLIALGLAEDIGGGRYRLAEGLDATLRTMGERGDIVRTMQRALTAKGRDVRTADIAIGERGTIIGRVLARGLADEHRDRHYLLIDGVDGRLHHVDIGRGDANAPTPENAIVQVRAPPAPAGDGARRQTADRVTLLATGDLAQLAGAEGATWLDRTLAAKAPLIVRDTGFGHELRNALELRRRWLVARQLAIETGGTVHLRADAIRQLERQSLRAAAAPIAAALGKPHTPAGRDMPVEGRLTRRIDHPGGSYALVERAHDFTLLPWKPSLERKLGQHISARVRSDGGLAWSDGRKRGRPALG
ncbi:DUF3363 domain-containing protein [Allosphingosinicella indica]|uniref:Type IV secretory pathway, VirD2 components (Relaxase) n=1 Tax=Allosphingosinicella indica TaxID=941907 RepID=A0A1X7FYQ3_9SPHN|nr:DUF3363 domain-containing protein [Allosphingosinicella indica]SMF61189.1 Type IV secretory pathway, VirD2 components (relaxase) [Allosphingosinicella indica]